MPNLWRDPDFLKLWVGETVSQLGTQISLVALPLTAILTLHASPAEVGLLGSLQFAPVLGLTLLAGTWVDVRPRRPALILTNLGRAVVLSAVPLLAWSGTLRMAYLYPIAFVAGSLTAWFDVAWLAYVPSLVGPDRLVEVNSRLQATYSTAQVGGPGLGGVLVQAVGAPMAMLADVASYLVAASSVAFIRRPEPPDR